MKITTKKIESGLWRIVIDGKPTLVVIGRGDEPKWGAKQEWAIGIDAGEYPDWLTDGIPGKSHCVDAVRKILDACGARP